MKLNLRRSRHSDKVTKERKLSLRLPLGVKIIYIFAAVCVPLYAAFLLSERFSDFFNRYISSAVRAFLAKLTGWIPFSLAEFALLLIPVWVFLVTRLILKRYGDTAKELVSSVVCVLSALALIFAVFTVGFAPAYRGSALDEKLGLERSDVSAEELYDTAMILADILSEESKNVVYGSDGFSVMPYSFEKMNAKLTDAYGKVCDEYDFVQRLDSKIKPVMLSEAMSYTHITGVTRFSREKLTSTWLSPTTPYPLRRRTSCLTKGVSPVKTRLILWLFSYAARRTTRIYAIPRI